MHQKISLMIPVCSAYSFVTEQITKEKMCDYINAIDEKHKASVAGKRIVFFINDDKYVLAYYNQGIFVFILEYSIEGNNHYRALRDSKTSKTNEILEQNSDISILMQKLDEQFARIKLKKNILFDGSYTDYVLTTYKLSGYNFEENVQLIWGLLRNLSLDQSEHEEAMKSIRELSVTLGDNVYLTAGWGARIFIEDEDHKESDYYESYLEAETDIQYCWLFTTFLRRKFDMVMSKGYSNAKIDKTQLLGKSYDLAYSIAKIKRVSDSNTTRYKIELYEKIVVASRLEKIYDETRFFINIVQEKIDQSRSKQINMVLYILSILGGISAIVSIVSAVVSADLMAKSLSLSLASILTVAILLVYVRNNR